MTSVLILIYLSGVASNLANLFLVVGLLGTIVCITLSVVVCFYPEDGYDSMSKETKDIIRPKVRRGVIVCPILLVLSCIMPSSSLLYIAAGLEAGDQVVHTEVAQKALRLLNDKLDELIKVANDRSREK